MTTGVQSSNYVAFTMIDYSDSESDGEEPLDFIQQIPGEPARTLPAPPSSDAAAIDHQDRPGSPDRPPQAAESAPEPVVTRNNHDGENNVGEPAESEDQQAENITPVVNRNNHDGENDVIKPAEPEDQQTENITPSTVDYSSENQQPHDNAEGTVNISITDTEDPSAEVSIKTDESSVDVIAEANRDSRHLPGSGAGNLPGMEAIVEDTVEVEGVEVQELGAISSNSSERDLPANNLAVTESKSSTEASTNSSPALLPSTTSLSSASCPAFQLTKPGTQVLQDQVHDKGQFLEYAFSFENQDGDLEGSDLEPLKDEQEDSDNAFFALTAGSSSESLDADMKDVVPKLDQPSVPLKVQEKLNVLQEDWVGIQKTTFTNWINNNLKPGKNDRKVVNILVDLKDGILLIKLLELLTKKKVSGFSGKAPKTVHHEMANLTLAFRFMRSESIQTIGIGPSNVYEGNEKLILGLIWMLIQQYHIRVVGYNISTKDAIIQWMKALLPKWNFTNLTSDWRDGQALIGVLNQVKHGIAPNMASLDPTKCRKNCSTALKAAQTHLKIPMIFSVDDLCEGKVDEMSMMTYLSYFVHPYRDKLLKWARKVIPHFGISGFTSDWYNGQAFAALITACFPGSVRYWPSMDSQKFVEAILRFALRNLGSTPPFSAPDLISGTVEEMQIMSMVMMIKNGELNTLAEEVRVSGPGTKEAQLHKETNFVVNTTGAGPGELFIDAYYEKDGERLKFSAKQKGSGEMHLKYTPKRLMNIVFAITWSDSPIPFSPFVVAVFDSTLVSVENFESHKSVVNVDEPLELIVDATRAGKGRLKANLVYSKKDRVDVMVTPISKGRYKLEYTPLKTGSAELHIWWNKTHLDHYQVAYTVVDREDYEVVSCPSGKMFCTYDEVEFVVSSSSDLPFNVLEMTAIIDYEFQLSIYFNNVRDGKGIAKFKPTTSGIYSVEVVCLDRFIKGAPFQIHVIDPSSLKLLQDIPAHLELGVPLKLEIDARGVSPERIAFVSPDVDIESKFKTKFCKNGSNLISTELIPLAEGDFLLGFKYSSHWISGSPFRMQICDPSKFSFVTNLRVANAGKQVNFSVKAREPSEGNMRLTFTAKGPQAEYTPRVTTSEDGLLYSGMFIPWEIGQHTITVSYGNFPIPGSPMTVPVIALDPTTCSATGMGLQRAYTKVPATFNVLGKAPKWVEDGTLVVRVSSVMTKEECRVRIRDNNDSTYSVAYMVEIPGAYFLEIQTAGQHIPGSPFKLNVRQGPDASMVKLYGPALKEGAVLTFGKPITFSINTKDAGNGKLTVKAVGPDNVSARVFIATSQSDGEHDIDVDPLRHGKHRVIIKWSGKHVPNSPFILKVFPGADASKCIAKGPGLEDGVMGKPTSFTIDTKLAGAGLLKVRLHGVKGAFKIQIKPLDGNNRRVLLANYDPKIPGEYLIKVLWCDTHIPGSPFRVKIIGDQTSLLPEVFTPTPRLPELDTSTNFMDDGNDGAHARLQSLPNVLATPEARSVTFNTTKKSAAANSNFKRSSTAAKSSGRSSGRSSVKKKKQYDGQMSVQMKSKSTSKFSKK